MLNNPFRTLSAANELQPPLPPSILAETVSGARAIFAAAAPKYIYCSNIPDPNGTTWSTASGSSMIAAAPAGYLDDENQHARKIPNFDECEDNSVPGEDNHPPFQN